MAALKKFVLLHGEKVVLVVVALLCLVSAGGTLVRFFNYFQLQYPEGEVPYTVQKEELPRWAETVKNHMAKTTTVMPDPAQVDLYSVMERNIANPIPKLAAVAAQWTLHVRPPDTNIPWGPTRQAAGQADPPAAFVTGLAAPDLWRIISTPTGVLVLVKGPEPGSGVRWPAEGEVGVLLMRNRVDSAKDELSTGIVNHFVERSSWSGPVDVAAMLEAERPPSPAAAATAEGGPPPEMGGVALGPVPPRRGGSFGPTGRAVEPIGAEPAAQPAAQPAAAGPRPLWEVARGVNPTPAPGAPAAGTVAPTDPAAGAPATTVDSTRKALLADPWEAVVRADADGDRQMREELKHIRSADAPGLRGWKPAGVMKMYDYTFTDEEIIEILRTGKLPAGERKPKLVDPTSLPPVADAAAAAAAVAAEGKAGEKSAEVQPAASVAKPRGDGMATDPIGAFGAEAAAGPIDQRDPYEVKYYAFFDDQGIDENAIYRYRFATFTKAKDLPPSVRSMPEYAAYPPRAELANGTVREASLALHQSTDVARGRFAYTLEEMQAFLAESAKADDALAEQIKPELLEWDAKLGTLKGMVRADNAPTKRALAYRRGDPCFSQWGYTSIVIVPPTKRILVRGVAPSMADPNVTEVKFRVEVQDGTETVRSPKDFLVAAPDQVKLLRWQQWVKTTSAAGGDDRRQPVVDPKTGRYETLSLEEVYNQLAYLRPTPIGGVMKVRGKDYDFTTNWGLVDVRDGEAVLQRYRIKPDGTREVAGPPTRTKVKYVVLRELRGAKPRYKHVMVNLRLPTATATQETKMERFIWDLELEAEQEKAAANRRPAAE